MNEQQFASLISHLAFEDRPYLEYVKFVDSIELEKFIEELYGDR